MLLPRIFEDPATLMDGWGGDYILTDALSGHMYNLPAFKEHTFPLASQNPPSTGRRMEKRQATNCFANKARKVTAVEICMVLWFA